MGKGERKKREKKAQNLPVADSSCLGGSDPVRGLLRNRRQAQKQKAQRVWAGRPIQVPARNLPEEL